MIRLFDAHCDTIMRAVLTPGAHLSGGSTAGGQWDLDRLDNRIQAVQCFAFFWDSAKVREPSEVLFERYLTVFRNEMSRYADRIVHCRSGEEIEQALNRGKHAALLTVEGAELLDCSLKRLRYARSVGVRAVNLTWNHANAVSGSHCDEPERGLSETGIRFMEEMERLGMLPDVSHLSEAGFWDVIENAKKPILASHSNSQNTFFHTRNLTDRQFLAIIENHGVVGLNGYARFIGSGTVTQTDLLRHLEHFLALGGEKTVALGGDWDGCSELPDHWNGIWNWRDFYELLLRENYNEDLIRDIFFNNLMRIVKQL